MSYCLRFVMVMVGFFIFNPLKAIAAIGNLASGRPWAGSSVRVVVGRL